MDQLDIKKIKYHAREIDRLCDKKNMIMNRTAERHHKTIRKIAIIKTTIVVMEITS